MIPVQNTVPVRQPPVIVWLLIAVNAAIFLMQISLPPELHEEFLLRFALVPARYTHPDWAARIGLDPGDFLPFAFNMFLHGGWLHILSNMWTLWLFGAAVEDRLGWLRFILLYVLAGLCASIAHVAANPDSAIPALGASGAIAGVLGAYMRMFPWSQVIVLFPVFFIPYFFALPAALYAAIWFGLQLLEGTLGLFADEAEAGGIAWWAHIGGFVAGLVLCSVLRPPPRRHRRYYPDEQFGFGQSGPS